MRYEELERDCVIAGWQRIGVRRADGILVVPLETTTASSVRDVHWRPLPDEDAFIRAHASIAVLARLPEVPEVMSATACGPHGFELGSTRS